MKLKRRSEINPKASKIHGLFEHNAFTEHEKNERPHKKTRKFDNQTFKLYHKEIMTKTGADALAEHLRNRGYLVRVLKEPGHSEWLIYYRKG